MTTTEAPAITRDLPELPKLERASVPPDLAALTPELKKLTATRTELLGKATTARSDFSQKLRAVKEAQTRDAEALTQAAFDGKPDPGRKHEAEAIRDLDEAHRIAEGLTRAANRATYEIRDAINGEAGTKAIEKLEAEREKELAALRKNADATLGNLGMISELGRLLEVVTKTRKGKSRAAIANAPARTTPVHVHGQPIDPDLILQALANGYEPEAVE